MLTTLLATWALLVSTVILAPTIMASLDHELEGLEIEIEGTALLLVVGGLGLILAAATLISQALA